MSMRINTVEYRGNLTRNLYTFTYLLFISNKLSAGTVLSARSIPYSNAAARNSRAPEDL
jgi:hypothetical protein